MQPNRKYVSSEEFKTRINNLKSISLSKERNFRHLKQLQIHRKCMVLSKYDFINKKPQEVDNQNNNISFLIHVAIMHIFKIQDYMTQHLLEYHQETRDVWIDQAIRLLTKRQDILFKYKSQLTQIFDKKDRYIFDQEMLQLKIERYPRSQDQTPKNQNSQKDLRERQTDYIKKIINRLNSKLKFCQFINSKQFKQREQCSEICFDCEQIYGGTVNNNLSYILRSDYINPGLRILFSHSKLFMLILGLMALIQIIFFSLKSLVPINFPVLNIIIFGIIAIMDFLYKIYKEYQKGNHNLFLCYYPTPSEYAFVVKNINYSELRKDNPNETLENLVWQQIQKQYPPQINDNKRKVYRVLIPYKITKFSNKKKDVQQTIQEALRDDNFDKNYMDYSSRYNGALNDIASMKQQLINNPLKNQILQDQTVVIMETPEMKNEIMQKYREKSNFVSLRNKLQLDQADEPYDHFGSTKISLGKRLIMILVFFLILCISFGVCLGAAYYFAITTIDGRVKLNQINYFSDPIFIIFLGNSNVSLLPPEFNTPLSKEYTIRTPAYFLLACIILIINLVMENIYYNLQKRLEISRQTQKEMIIKTYFLSIFTLINTIAVPFLVIITLSQIKDIDNKDSISTFIQYISILNIYVENIYNVLYTKFKDTIKMFALRGGFYDFEYKTQRQLNRDFGLTKFEPELHYLYINRTFIFVGFYFTLEPRIIFFAFSGLVFKYCIDVYFLQVWNKKPPIMKDRIYVGMEKWVEVFIPAYSIGSILTIVYTNYLYGKLNSFDITMIIPQIILFMIFIIVRFMIPETFKDSVFKKILSCCKKCEISEQKAFYQQRHNYEEEIFYNIPKFERTNPMSELLVYDDDYLQKKKTRAIIQTELNTFYYKHLKNY